jgi:hypothetical protein
MPEGLSLNQTAPAPVRRSTPEVQVATLPKVPDDDSEPVGLITTPDGQQILKAAPTAVFSAFAPPPKTLPDNANARAELLTRPPLVPPLTVVSDEAVSESGKRCQDALFAARSLVERPLTLPVEMLQNSAWKEQALRGTELTQLACRGERGEQAASYWRATAFLLHGQYSRAALYYNRIAENPSGAYGQWGYAKGLGRMLDACSKTDRPSLDAWTLAGLLEARGARNDARLLYTRSEQARCEALRIWSKARMALLSQ